MGACSDAAGRQQRSSPVADNHGPVRRYHYHPAPSVHASFTNNFSEVIDFIGRSERIRTSGPCVPNTVLYQAELHSDRAPGYSRRPPTGQDVFSITAPIGHPDHCAAAPGGPAHDWRLHPRRLESLLPAGRATPPSVAARSPPSPRSSGGSRRSSATRDCCTTAEPIAVRP